MKGFVFLCSKEPLRKRQNSQSKGANNATRTSRVVFPARQFRQGVPLAVGERARPMVGPSAVGAARFRLTERREGEQHHLRGSEACLRPHPSGENGQGLSNRPGDQQWQRRNLSRVAYYERAFRPYAGIAD